MKKPTIKVGFFIDSVVKLVAAQAGPATEGVKMALISLLSFTVSDAAGHTANVQVAFPASATLAQIQAYATDMAPLLDAVTGAKVISSQVTLAITLPAGLKADPTADVFIQSGANLGFSAEDTTYRHTVRIPAINPAYIDGENVLITGQTAMENFVLEYTAGDGTLSPTDKFANNLTALLGAERSFWSK